MFKLISTPDFKWDVVWFGNDESRVVARFFERNEAQDYANWRNRNRHSTQTECQSCGRSDGTHMFGCET